MSAHRRRRVSHSHKDVKDRLIQTRVPERLENVLREEAQKRRLSVSHLIRNILEDTLDLVDTVVSGAEDFVGGSVEFAEQVKRDAGRIASSARAVARPRTDESPDADAEAVEPESPSEHPSERATEPSAAPRSVHGGKAGRHGRTASLDDVLAWNPVVLNKSARCAACRRDLPRGSSANLGVSRDPSAAPAWLCVDCLSKL